MNSVLLLVKTKKASTIQAAFNGSSSPKTLIPKPLNQEVFVLELAASGLRFRVWGFQGCRV